MYEIVNMAGEAWDRTNLTRELAEASAKLVTQAAEIEQNRIDLNEYRLDVERLRALLEPFGKAADGFDGYNIKNPEEWFAYGGVQGSGETTGAITVGDLRRARAALALPASLRNRMAVLVENIDVDLDSAIDGDVAL